MAVQSIDVIDTAEIAGEIDDTANLKNNAVYIFSGGELDTETPPKGQQAQKIVYEHYGVTKLTYVEEEVGHYFQKGYMLPGLKQLYVDLGYASDLNDFEPSVPEAELGNYGAWMDFDQGDFVGVDSTLKDEDGKTKAWKWSETAWGDRGKAFIPHSCYSTTCRVHVAFHGCMSNGDVLAYRSEYINFAASNNVIVVYPNSYCWSLNEEMNIVDDLWMTSEGLYLKSTNNIICRLTSTEKDNTCPKGASPLLQVAFALAAVSTMLLF